MTDDKDQDPEDPKGSKESDSESKGQYGGRSGLGPKTGKGAEEEAEEKGTGSDDGKE